MFLDRDGTINVRAAEHDYIRDPSAFRWLPGAVDGLVALARGGFPLVVVSNQRGVSRGLVTQDTLSAIERLIQDELAMHGCRIESFRYCTHSPAEHCDCRKPNPGMLTAAAAELDLDLPSSWMIGDTDDDVAAGRAAGCRTILLSHAGRPGERTAASLAAAAALVLAQTPSG